MDSNKDIQNQVKRIPLFTVIKNGSILKNIFLFRKQYAINKSSSYQDSDEEILFLGRHPHCNITLEHPSISRYHLRIHSDPSSHTLSVVDLSSVHGTWVSGKRIEPGVHVKLKEGDTMRIGGSSRIYELHWMPDIYTIKEGEDDINQDEKSELHSSHDDLGCSILTLSNKIHESPPNTLKPLTSSAPNYFNSSSDGAEEEHLSTWRTDNENGEVFATILVQPPLVVSETKSATEISDKLNNLEDELNWLRDNLSNESEDQDGEMFTSVSVPTPCTTSASEINDSLNSSEDEGNWLRDNLTNKFELQNDGIIKQDPFSETSCSKSSTGDIEVERSSPWRTANENDVIFATVSVQAPVRSETTSATEISDILNNTEDELNWLRDNLSNEFELQNGKIFTTISVQIPLTTSATEINDSLNNSEDERNWLRDNLSNEFELKNGGIIKQDPFLVSSCSKSSCDDIEVEHSSPWKTGNEIGEVFATVSDQAPTVVSETTSAIEISDSLNEPEDQLNWLRDNLSNKYELEDGEIFTTVSVQAPLSTSEIYDKLNNSEDGLNWLRDNLSNEFELQTDGIIKQELFSAPNFSKSSSDVTEVEHSSPWKTGNQNGEISASVSVQSPLVVSEAISETEVSDSLNNSKDHMNSSREDLSNEFELQNHQIFREDLLTVLNRLKSSCADTEVGEYTRLQKTGNKYGNHYNTVYIQAPLIVSEAVSETENTNSLNNLEDQLNWPRDNLSYEFEQFGHGIMKDDLDSVDVFDPIETLETAALRQDLSRINEIDMGNENEQENQEKIENVSVPEALSDGVNRNGEESFMPDIAGSKEVKVCYEFEHWNQMRNLDETPSMVLFKGVNMGVKFESIDHEKMKEEPGFVFLPSGTDMGQEKTFTPDTSKANKVSMNAESMKNVSVPLNLFCSLDGNELELYTPDKENKNPNACSGKSLRKIWKEDGSKQSKLCTMSQKPVGPVYEEEDIFGFSQRLFTSVDESNNVFTTHGGMNTTDKGDPFIYCEEVLLSSTEKVIKSKGMKMEECCNSNYPQTIQKAINSSHNLAKKRWTLVVDTNSLLHNESLKNLKLLEGLKGTQLYVPKFVMRELMDIKSQDNFLKFWTKKVSLALKWIEECMVNTSWWIHVDDQMHHSSTAEPQVLETALHFHKEITDRQIIILSIDLTLKIKAMAEGIMCEAAEEFFRSLVNPFSERFMWVGSRATGPTWSYVDDDIMRQKYYGCGLNGSYGLKGLKLLAYNRR